MHVVDNVVYFNKGNTLKHELAKALGALQILKYGDVKFNQRILDALQAIQEECASAFIVETIENQFFLTEAVPVDNPERRVDLVSLNLDSHIEFETDHTIKKSNAVTIYI